MNNIKPANRLNSVQEYYFSRKLKEVANLNLDGKDIISLAIGSPDLPPSSEAINKLCSTAKEPNAHGYQPTMGIPELRQAMAKFYYKWYGVGLDAASEILPLIGSKEGILHITLAFVNPGEKVLVPNPGYPTYTSLSKIIGANIINYNLTPDNGWQPDFEELEQKDLSQVKLMWTNYPNMPTGCDAKIDTFRRLVDFGRRKGIVIVNDNPYSLILNEHPVSLLQVEGAKDCCIELNSMSKSFNMPGWRIGMCMSNPQFISWILKVKSNIDSGFFRGLQMAAAEALVSNKPEWHIKYNIDVYQRRRNIAEQIMQVLGCTYDKKQVGMFLWGKVADKYSDAEVLTERVLHEARVFITPGIIFGSNGKQYIRISLCASEDKMKEALHRINILSW